MKIRQVDHVPINHCWPLTVVDCSVIARRYRQLQIHHQFVWYNHKTQWSAFWLTSANCC